MFPSVMFTAFKFRATVDLGVTAAAFDFITSNFLGTAVSAKVFDAVDAALGDSIATEYGASSDAKAAIGMETTE
ncbi:MAG: hypothetical protein LBI10_02220 [Deltaproteobacteria bacterium]|nr:hypothetical protein [Deltaproteobacteria bacterium]